MKHTIIDSLIKKKDLLKEEISVWLQAVLNGSISEIEIAAVLVLLAAKGESGFEIASFSEIVRGSALKFQSKKYFDINLSTISAPILCDTCGTGGDGAATINISTLSALVLAQLGLPMAKHGNRAVSGPCGSADLLEKLGLNIELSPQRVVQTLEDIGLTFLYAPLWNPAMKFVAPVRKTLGVRTIFNLIGPLSNPAPITHQIIGVYDVKFLEPLASALLLLKRRAYVIHADGLDEVSYWGETSYIKVGIEGIEERGKILPEDFGLNTIQRNEGLRALQIQNSQESFERSLKIIQGRGSRIENDVIAMNAALLYSLVKNISFREANTKCIEVLLSGNLEKLLENWKHSTI